MPSIPKAVLDLNLVIRSLSPSEQEWLAQHSEIITLKRGDVLLEPGDDFASMVFPLAGTTISLLVPLADGRFIETATVGAEGAFGGIFSQGYLPAFTRAAIQMGGEAVRVSAGDMQAIKGSLPLWNVMVRYSHCLVAQILQTVACNAAHSFEQRCARWLLTLHSRLGSEVLPVTHELLAEMLGVQRPYVTKMLKDIQRKGCIELKNSKIIIIDRTLLQESACECHQRIHNHFSLVLGAVFASDGAIVEFDPNVALEDVATFNSKLEKA